MLQECQWRNDWKNQLDSHLADQTTCIIPTMDALTLTVLHCGTASWVLMKSLQFIIMDVSAKLLHIFGSITSFLHTIYGYNNDQHLHGCWDTITRVYFSVPKWLCIQHIHQKCDILYFFLYFPQCRVNEECTRPLTCKIQLLYGKVKKINNLLDF